MAQCDEVFHDPESGIYFKCEKKNWHRGFHVGRQRMHTGSVLTVQWRYNLKEPPNTKISATSTSGVGVESAGPASATPKTES